MDEFRKRRDILEAESRTKILTKKSAINLKLSEAEIRRTGHKMEKMSLLRESHREADKRSTKVRLKQQLNL